MNRCISKALAVAWALSSASVAVPGAVFAAEPVAVTIELPSQSLATALRELARQADIQIAVQSELADGKTAPSLSGKYAPAVALQTLLQGSDLVAYRINEHTFGIRSIHANPSSSTFESTGRIQLAQADESTEPAQLEEIIVTATKRAESVREISGSVSALTGGDLSRLGAQSMEDYLTRTPGVVFNGAIPGLSSAVIRGISTTTATDQGQGTTAISSTTCR